MASSGWVEERGKGKWRLNVNCGANDDGSRKVVRETVKAKNRDAALKQLGLLINRIEKGEYVEPAKQTFSAFVEKWLKSYAEKTLAPKTLYRYKQLLDSRILPALGHLKLDKIKPVHLIEFYGNLTEDGIREDGRKGGLSERTILHHHRLISAILQDAVEWQVIASNPASRVSPPKVHSKHGKFYNEEQTKALLAAVELEDEKHKALIYLAVFCGLRCGEIMGLEWQDIDFEKSTLTVRQAGQYIPGQGTFTKDPKNESSQRVISLPLRVLNVLSQHKAKQEEAADSRENLWHNSDRVFTTRDGKPAHPEWPSQWFPKFLRAYNIKAAFNTEIKISSLSNKLDAQEIASLTNLKDRYLKLNNGNSSKNSSEKKAEVERSIISIIGEKGLERIKQSKILPPLPFHGLRHTAATIMISQGADVRNLSNRLGHANTSTTLNIYSHALKTVDKDIAEKTDAYIKKLIPQEEQAVQEQQKNLILMSQ